VAFDGGRARGAARLIDSDGLRKERAAGKMLYGFSAPLRHRVRHVFKNVGNTNVMAWQGRMLALVESSRPQDIDPLTLDTRGETDLGGVVRGPFSAHPHRVPARQAIYNFGVRMGRRAVLDLYELPDRGRARRLATLPLGVLPVIHDFIATENHLIFFICPARIHLLSALARGRFDKLFQWHPNEGTEILVVPIDAPRHAVRISQPAFWNWHFANAFERAGRVVVDVVRYPDFRSFSHLATGQREFIDGGHLMRATFAPHGGNVIWERLLDEPCEFPQVPKESAGTDAEVLWLQVEGQRHGIGRLDVGSGRLRVWDVPAHQRASEPVIAGRYVLTLVCDFDEMKSHVAVLDGEAPEKGPLARAWFDHHIPITFHGTWVPGV
jgi:all-trans-8'-apo-beta-carotenal 15,15'-oxygenase